ncbi:MAG: exopolysaccharide biosynthesis polyprenyl glycosylphosphotransferase [Clostridia bacterium]|nr:exopolysaccharide biosynthesis polyprenyl glycosylphosphotransferase [Clostridia bacterium]
MEELFVQSKKNHPLAIMLIKILHIVATLALFYAFWILFRYHGFIVERTRGFRYNIFVLIGYGILLIFFNRTYNSYLLGYMRVSTLAFSQFLAQLFSLFIMYAAVCIAWRQLPSPAVFLPLLIVYVFLDAVWSFLADKLFLKYNPPRKTVFVYRNETDKKRFGSVSGKPIERLYSICGEIRYEGDSFDDIRERVEPFDAVFVAGIRSQCRNGIAKYCAEQDISGFFLPHVGDIVMQGGSHVKSFSSPVLFVSRKEIRLGYRIFKRALDILLSFIGLIILSPVMLVTALLIHFYDRGPVFYRQTRLTQYGRTFEIIKFRSMRTDAEKDGVARLSTGEKDDRITPVGRVIRRFRIDELPQLFNILKGDMSIVGPRPERPEIAAQYDAILPDFKLRLQAKAGLTGYAQIYGRYNSSPYEKMEFDLMYINQMSLVTDFQLMFATVGVLFMPESTEGISEGEVVADVGEREDS